MQIGTNAGGRYEFRTSQMQIVALPNNALPNDILPNNVLPNGQRPGGVRPPPIPTPPVLPPGANAGQVGGSNAIDGSERQFFADILRDKQPQPQVMRLAIRDDRGRDWFLGKSNNNRLAMHGAANPAVADWHVVPAGRGYVRVSQRVGNDWLALAATQARGLTIEPLGQKRGSAQAHHADTALAAVIG